MGTPKKAARAAVKADHKLSRKATCHRDTPAVRGAAAVGELADQPPLILASVATIVAGAVLRRPAVVRGGVRMLASHLIATGIKTAIKRSIDRTRPARAIASGEHRFEPGDSDEHDQNSFPSGHTAGAVAIAAAISRDAPDAALPAYAAAGGVAAIQLPSGNHYLIDTIAGAAIGYVGEMLASAALRLAEAALATASDRVRRPPPSAHRPDRSAPT